MRNIEVGITDHYDPEVQAMLLAMYSRSFAPIAGRLPDTEESAQQHKEKLGKFYTQWGHKSVGQLGVTTVWLEGVSQLAAKAIENHPLFNGQESSTRYINYGTQPCIIPSGVEKELAIDIDYWQEKWIAFYNKALPVVTQKLKEDYPFELSYSADATEEQSKKNRTTWENTIKAKAFDMCRGFLPAGSVTNVGFMGTFDTLNDHFGEMLYHPSAEMRSIATEVLTSMKAKYPYGTMDLADLKERFSYVDSEFFYGNGQYCRDGEQIQIDKDDLAAKDEEHSVYLSSRLNKYLVERKKGQRLDRVTASKLMFTMRGYIDFGSYRDLQRHRAGVIDMNILSPAEGIHQYYKENLNQELLEELNILMTDYANWYKDAVIGAGVYNLQYCTPMGYIIHVTYKCDINQVLYLLELRSSKTVHQTLRLLILEWFVAIKKKVGNLNIHVDTDLDNFTLKRGTQTIVTEQESIN